MRYTVLRNAKVASGHYAQAGDEVELTKDQAAGLLAAGLVELVREAPAKAPAKAAKPARDLKA